MLETLLAGGIAGAVVAVVVSLIAFRIYRQNLESTLIQQQGWEHAQETRQQEWELKQKKRVTSLEERLTTDVQQVQQEWDVWEQRDITRVQSLEHQYESATAQITLEYTLEHLPFAEEASLPSPENQSQNDATAKARPIQLAGEDLSGRNLSRRYLGGANLRGALLTNANFFMADLSHACLVGADLSGADLSGANLVGADLSNAILINTNMLVADVNNTNFSGADLSKVRNLVLTQVETTEAESATLLDEEMNVTQTRLPIIPKSATTTPTIPQKTPASTVSNSTYDIVRAQSLDAIPEPEEAAAVEQISSILSFPGMLPETPFPFSDDETEVSPWSPAHSDETLHVLEEVSVGRQDYSRSDDFDTTSSKEMYDGQRRVRAS